MKWFFKVERFHGRKSLRTRSKLTNILAFLSNLPFGVWRDIRKITIERIG